MRIKKKIRFKIIIIILIPLILTGCWDNRELDKISIVISIGIDAVEDKDKINFILQIERVSQHNTGGDPSESAIILETEERGVLSAIKKLQKQVTRDLFLHHNQVVIFGKEQAEKGIQPYIDAFLRQQDMRMETLVFIAEGEAKDIIYNSMKQDSAFSSGITRIVDATNKYHESHSVRVLDLVSTMLEETTAPTIPIVKLDKHKTELRLFLTGLAVFNEGGMIGQLNETETRGYNWIMDKFKSTLIGVDTEKGFSNLNMSNIKYKIKPKIDDENELMISLEIIGDIVISEIQGFNNMTAEEVMNILLEEGEKEINREIQICFNKSKELNADFLRFGVKFEKRFPREWKEMKDNWHELYQEVQLSTKIELNLIDTGKIVNSLNMKEED